MASAWPERLERFFARGPGCWDWTGYIRPNGYGDTRDADQRKDTAHRVVYEALVGPVPEGLELDHLCRNRACVNPAHLEAVTHLENVHRGLVGLKVAQTHCINGHEYTPENTYIQRGVGTRKCQSCRREASLRARLVQKGASS